MSESYLKEWLNIYLKLSKEIKDIPSDFSNGYLFGEILHRHKLIPNFDSYKNTNEKKDISKNYQYLSKAFVDLHIKFSDDRRNDIINKKKGIASQYLFKLKQVIDQKLLCKETLKFTSGPNELHKLFKQLRFPNENEKYYRDLLNRNATKEKVKLPLIQQFLNKEGKYYADIGKHISSDQKFLDNKRKTMYNNVFNLEKNRAEFCENTDNEYLKNWNHQMDIKRDFDKKQLKKIWSETVFYKTATLGSFKNSNNSNMKEIKNFNETLSRLGLDVPDNNLDKAKNYMSPQIILKLYRDKIAQQEKSRKDKEKRIRKLHKEEDKMLENNKNKSTKKMAKTYYTSNVQNKKDTKKKKIFVSEKSEISMSEINKYLDSFDDVENYEMKKINYEETKKIHEKEEIPLLKTISAEEKKIFSVTSFDFFDEETFFLRLNRLTPQIIKRRIEKKQKKDSECINDMKNLINNIINIAEESDNYLMNNKCELIEIPEWEKWMQLFKDNIDIKDFNNNEKEKSIVTKKSSENNSEIYDLPEMVLYKENELFNYINFMGNWDINLKEKILSQKNNNTDNYNNTILKLRRMSLKSTSTNNNENPLEMSLYKILGNDIAFMLNAGKYQINGLKESQLSKMKNKEFEPGQQDINNITLPLKYLKNGHIGEIIEFYINLKYEKKNDEKKNNDLKDTLPQMDNINININNNNPVMSKLLTREIIKEETKHEIDPSDEPSIVKENNENLNFNKSGGQLLQSGDEGIEAKLLEEIKKSEEKYTFDHIPIKICFIGSSFSGRKTQANLIHEKYSNIKIYNVEKIIQECKDIYYKITTPIEEQPKYKNIKKNQIEQVKLEIENLEKEFAYQKSIIEPLVKGEISTLSDDTIIDLLIFNIRKDFPMKEKSLIENEIKQLKEKIKQLDIEIEASENIDQTKKNKGKLNDNQKNNYLKEKEQLINNSFSGFIIVDFPKTLAQFKLFEYKCTGFVEELDKEKTEKEIELDNLLYPLDKIYHPSVKSEDIKSVFNYFCIFNVEEEEILNRVNGRLYDKETDTIYHKIYNPPNDKDKKLMQRLEPMTEPTEEKILSEIKNYCLNLIDIKDFLDLFKNCYEVMDLKDKNEEMQNITTNALEKSIEEYENKFIDKNNIPSAQKIVKSPSNILNNSGNEIPTQNSNVNENIPEKNNQENVNINNVNNNVNNVNNNTSNVVNNTSNINNNSIGKNNNSNAFYRKSSTGGLSNKTFIILPILMTPLTIFNKRYAEVKKRLSLSNLDALFLNKYNKFLIEYKTTLTKNFVNIFNMKYLIQNEAKKIEEEFIQFLNLPSNKREIIDRFTTKLSTFRSQFKEIKSHKLVIEEFQKDLTELTNGIWNIINVRKQQAIDKRKKIMDEGFFEKQIKLFYENIENMFLQETSKFLLSVNIIKEFYYGLQSEILKSVILPFTSQIEEIDINTIFKDTKDLPLISKISGSKNLNFPKMEKIFYNCLKIIFLYDYAIKNVDNKLRGSDEGPMKINNNNSSMNSVSIISRGKITKKKKGKKKNLGDSLSEESKEIFNFTEELISAIDVEKSNYKYRILTIKYYAINTLGSINNISNQLFDLLDNWIIDSVHFQNHMMNKLLERLSKIVNNCNMKIMWDFELDKYSQMKIKNFEFIDPYKSMLEDDNESENREIMFSKYLPIISTIYTDIVNFTLQNEFISRNTLIDILLKKNLTSLELKNTPLYKLNFHMYEKLIDKMIIKNRNSGRSDLINIKHFFTILLLLPIPVINISQSEQIQNDVKNKILFHCFLKENDFKESKLWFENSKIFKIEDDEENVINRIKGLLYLIFAKNNGTMNFEDYYETITLKIFENNDSSFSKDKIKYYKDLLF